MVALVFDLTECPEGFVRGIFGQQCYLFLDLGQTWYEAEEFCENKNPYLAELIDVNERNAVFNYAKGKHSDVTTTQKGLSNQC